MKRDRKFAKNRKCNDPMNFKGGGFNVTLFDDRLWKLSSPSEQVEKNTLLGVKRHSITNVKFKLRPFSVYRQFVGIIVKKKVKEGYPSPSLRFSIVDSIEHARNSKRILDSTRNAPPVSHPVKTIPLSLPGLLPQLPPIRAVERRLQRDLVSATTSSRHDQSIAVAQVACKSMIHRECSINRTIVYPLHHFISD